MNRFTHVFCRVDLSLQRPPRARETRRQQRLARFRRDITTYCISALLLGLRLRSVVSARIESPSSRQRTASPVNLAQHARYGKTYRLFRAVGYSSDVEEPSLTENTDSPLTGIGLRAETVLLSQRPSPRATNAQSLAVRELP